MHRFTFAALGILAARIASAQIVGPADHIVGSITLPGPVQGDVAVVGTALVVGQGTFGTGMESVVRRDWNGTITTLATGFNSLSSFATSPQGDLLFVADNGGDHVGAITGDTVFALDDPRTATGAVSAAGHETAAPGSIPFAQGLAVSATGELYATNAAGSTNGTVLRHRSFLFPPFVTHASGFGYTAGLAFGPAGTLFVGDVDANTFAGRVVELDANGAVLQTLASGLSGAIDQAFDRSGNLLVSGGFTNDFSSSTIVSISPAGAVTEFAHGFTFSSGMDVDPIGGRVYATDFGSNVVTTFVPIAALVPGGGLPATDCFAEFSDVVPVVNRRGRAINESTCQDGSSCDRDGVADGVCTFGVGICFNVSGNAACSPAGADTITMLPVAGVVDPEIAALGVAATAALPTTTAVCVGPAPITVATRMTPTGRRAGLKLVRTRTAHTTARGRKQTDSDTLTLRCVP